MVRKDKFPPMRSVNPRANTVTFHHLFHDHGKFCRFELNYVTSLYLFHRSTSQEKMPSCLVVINKGKLSPCRTYCEKGMIPGDRKAGFSDLKNSSDRFVVPAKGRGEIWK
jgi:hypothetical protein